MTTPFNPSLLSRSPANTQSLGRRIGATLSTGMVLTLTGDLGSGKTAFVQGLARGLDVPDEYYVTSPTYTIINEYPGRLPLFHIDLYRMSGVESLDDIGLYDIFHPEHVIAIEWPALIASELPEDHLALKFEIIDDEKRNISIRAYGLNAQDVIKRLDI